MSIFEEKDIIDSKIKIDEQIIKDFDCSYGYMVLVDYEPFIERIQELDRKGHQIAYKKVKYGSPSMELSLQLLSQKTVENLFIKRSEYEHQKEFRIVVIEDYTDEEYSLREEGENFSKTYNLSSDLHDIARKIDISSLDAEEGYRIFHIPEKV